MSGNTWVPSENSIRTTFMGGETTIRDDDVYSPYWSQGWTQDLQMNPNSASGIFYGSSDNLAPSFDSPQQLADQMAMLNRMVDSQWTYQPQQSLDGNFYLGDFPIQVQSTSIVPGFGGSQIYPPDLSTAPSAHQTHEPELRDTILPTAPNIRFSPYVSETHQGRIITSHLREEIQRSHRSSSTTNAPLRAGEDVRGRTQPGVISV